MSRRPSSLPCTGAGQSLTGAGQCESVVPGMRVGLYGGSFDPVHDGHWHVAETARRRLALDRVWWVVSPQNPLKTPPAGDYNARFNAVRNRIGRAPNHVVTDIERRLGIMRTCDLVAHLRARAAGVRFVLIMGGDSLASFHHWARWRFIARTVDIAVISRPGTGPHPALGKAGQVLAANRNRLMFSRPAVVKHQTSWVYICARHNGASSTALRVLS